MGEYGIYKGQRIKLGTCESMYYLRWDQAHLVAAPTEYETNVTDPDILPHIRFRFPFPDEDHVKPGEFDDYERRDVVLHGFEQPNVDHYTVQFKAQDCYLVSLPCPEATTAPLINANGKPVTIHRNGRGANSGAILVEQAWRGGKLCGIAECRGCGARYRLDEGYEEAAAVALRSEADRATGERATFLHTIADRLLAGYQMTVPA